MVDKGIKKKFTYKAPPAHTDLGYDPSIRTNRKAKKSASSSDARIKKNGSDARIKMVGDIPIAAGWWSWLLR